MKTASAVIDSYVIDKKTWLRGEGDEKSFLLRPEDNKMCCLGHYLRHRGLKDGAITNVHAPAMVMEKGVPDWLLSPQPSSTIRVFPNDNSGACSLLMEINDNPETNDAEKQREIRKIFADNGVKVTFK